MDRRIMDMNKQIEKVMGHHPFVCLSPEEYFKKKKIDEINMRGHDTVVQCPKCGHKEYLDFINGLKNGWSECCGQTMPILKTTANIPQIMKKMLGSWEKT